MELGNFTGFCCHKRLGQQKKKL